MLRLKYAVPLGARITASLQGGRLFCLNQSTMAARWGASHPAGPVSTRLDIGAPPRPGAGVLLCREIPPPAGAKNFYDSFR